MVYTSHGHHVSGTFTEIERPKAIARCGGPGVCTSCSRESAIAQEEFRTDERKAEPSYARDHQLQAKIGIVEVFNKEVLLDHGAVGQGPVTVDDIYTVTFGYTLGNWKGTFSSDAWSDTSYFEVTYNKEKGQMYVDHYRKVSNTCFDDDPIQKLRENLAGDAR